MTIHCIHRARLSEYVDGDLAADRAAEVRRHVEEDPGCGCRQEVAALERMIGALRRLEPGPAPAGGWERVEHALDHPSRAIGVGWSVPAWAAAAVVLAAGLAAALALRGISGREPTSPDPTSPGELPRLLTSAAGADLPPIRISEELLVRYGAEIRPVDRLIGALREIPGAGSDDREIQQQIEQLTALRSDLLAELVLQAQASDAGPWQ